MEIIVIVYWRRDQRPIDQMVALYRREEQSKATEFCRYLAEQGFAYSLYLKDVDVG